MQQRLLPVASVTLLACIALAWGGHAAKAQTSDPVLVPTAIAGSTAPVPTAEGLASRLTPLLNSRTMGDAVAVVLDPATGETLFDRASSNPHVPPRRPSCSPPQPPCTYWARRPASRPPCCSMGRPSPWWAGVMPRWSPAPRRALPPH